jgi:3-mercaptopyruvate sulfurtransferase SseA/regulator of RNase E activity RraA
MQDSAANLPPLAELAQRLYTAVLSDVLDELGFMAQALRPFVRPLDEASVLCGFARTGLYRKVFHIEPGRNPYEIEMDLIDGLKPGEVAVLACDGPTDLVAPWGELLTTAAGVRGAAGCLTDGLVRDVRRIREMKFPVFAGGIGPLDTKGRAEMAAMDVPVEVARVRIEGGGAGAREGRGRGQDPRCAPRRRDAQAGVRALRRAIGAPRKAERRMPEGHQPLVSPDWLAQHLDDPSLLILDVRIAPEGNQESFESGHIPGAAFTDYLKDGWRAVQGTAIGMLPDEGALSEFFGGLGLTPDRHIVVVPTGNNTSDFSAAARVYWTLKIAGHLRLSLLDGGWAGWRADPSRSVETGPGETRTGTPYPVRIDPAMRADVERVEKAVAGGSATLLDARGIGYFEGREKSPQAMRAGRLPGARHLDQA